MMTAATQPAKLLGIPLGDFGFFSSLLLSLASGFLAFFASCFIAIINYADSYRLVAFPIGLAVLAFGLFFFTGTWIRRKFSGQH
jgi:hypothetical protein